MKRIITSIAVGLFGSTLLAFAACAQPTKTMPDTDPSAATETTDVTKGKDGQNNSQCGGRGTKGLSNQGNGGTVKGNGSADGLSGQGNGAGNGCVITGQTFKGDMDFSGGNNNGKGGKIR